MPRGKGMYTMGENSEVGNFFKGWSLTNLDTRLQCLIKLYQKTTQRPSQRPLCIPISGQCSFENHTPKETCMTAWSAFVWYETTGCIWLFVGVWWVWGGQAPDPTARRSLQGCSAGGTTECRGGKKYPAADTDTCSRARIEDWRGSLKNLDSTSIYGRWHCSSLVFFRFVLFEIEVKRTCCSPCLLPYNVDS